MGSVHYPKDLKKSFGRSLATLDFAQKNKNRWRIITLKRIIKVVTAAVALVTGAVGFADEAEYQKLLSQGKAYEEKNQWIHAMGTYWDAIGANPAGSKEATDALISIRNGFVDDFNYGTGNPGPGEYDDFSRIDGWIAVCKEYETYWTEHSGEIYTIVLECKKGELDMKTRTATYNFTAETKPTKKFQAISDAVLKSFAKGYSQYHLNDIPSQWPGVSIFKDSKTIPIVKFISATNSFGYDVGLELDGHVIVGDGSVEFLNGKTTEYYVAAWNNLVPLADVNFESDVSSNLEAKIKIIDNESGKKIASMKNPVVFEKNGYAEFSISGIAADDIKTMDSGKWHFEFEAFTLKPGTVIRKLDYLETKITNFDRNCPPVDFMKGNGGYANVDFTHIAELEAKIQELYASMKIVKWYNREVFGTELRSGFLAVRNITEGLKEYDLGDLAELISKRYGGEWDYDRPYRMIYRELTTDEQKQLEEQKKRQEEEKEETAIKNAFNKGILHTNLVQIQLTEKKGIVTVAAVPADSDFEKAGLLAKDVITDITVKLSDGSTKTIQVSELTQVSAPATCVFSIQRGKGKKAQSLKIEVPVNWNEKELQKISY